MSSIRLELAHPDARGLLLELAANLGHDCAHLFVVAKICQDVQNATFRARNRSEKKNCLSSTTVLGRLAFVNMMSYVETRRLSTIFTYVGFLLRVFLAVFDKV